MISIDDLRALVEMNPKTGLLTWRVRPVRFFSDSPRNDAKSLCAGWNKRWAGKPAFNTPDQKGYLRGKLFNVKLRAHQVAFALANGHWPEDQVDHENGVRSDNKPVNLRDASNLENSRNRKISSKNTTGHAGVHVNRKDGLYWATIRAGGKQILLGRFKELSDAVEARSNAARAHGYHPNHGRAA